MTNTLERAMSEAASLPEAAQELIGRELLAHIERLRVLRAEIDEGITSLDAGSGREVDIEALILRARRDFRE